ncbi:hypothetical protein [Actinospica robiniae]|uniref:hypothetical protein n=1 Tax=Actinospica robiniae TaxID=304901 RepID=UPI000422E3D1|nr:hypothetical protein [Actinospica robiniae]
MAARLDALRGPVPPRSHDARTIAALTVNPGCSRRAVLDAAGVDKRRLAERVGSPARFGQSPFAITRGLMFEKQIKADGCAQLLDLLRSELGFDVPGHEYVDLGVEPAATPGGAGGVATDRGSRYRRTRELFSRVADGAAVLADHPLLTLEVAGRTAYVEPDVVALRARRTGPDPGIGGSAGLGASAGSRAGSGGGAGAGAAGDDTGADSSLSGGLGLSSDDEPASGSKSLLYIAEVKSFSVIDGQADPTKVGAAATQAAVYVLALRRLFESLGIDPELVASDVVLVCPKDFSNSPTAHLVDVRRQIAAVSRQLDRLPRIEALVAGLDSAIDFDLSVDQPADKRDAPHPHRSGGELTKSLSMIEARYAPECVTRCELAFHCRAEARAIGSADALGRSVRDALGGVVSLDEALALASGDELEQVSGSIDVGDVGGVGGAMGAAGAARPGGGGEAARLLRAAARAYDEAMAMQPRVPEAAAQGGVVAEPGESKPAATGAAGGSGAVVAPRGSGEDAAATVPGSGAGAEAGS